MNNVLLYLGALLVVTLAALFAVPHFIDWNGYRGVFEEEATKVLGRDVRVGGAVNVRLLPTPFVSFEKVRLADPTGQTGEPFVRAESFTMRLSGPALLRGVLEANEVELEQPVLTLALDDKGSGNWSSIEIRSGALPFVPKDVTLRAVRITNGAINFYNAKAEPVGRAAAISGIFSADSIKGPFNFKGSAEWSGSKRKVRFATTTPDASGAFQIKANVQDTASTASYLLDARVESLSSAPRLAGALTGTFPLTEAAPGTSADDPIPQMDLKAEISANTAGAEIKDLALSVQNEAEPQLISGSAKAVWGANSEFNIDLNSKWLDLDRLAGAGKDAATFFKVKHLGLSILRALAGDGKAAAKLNIDQVKLGGETTGAMHVNAERRGTAVSLNELRAGLPGGARLDLSGDLKDAGGSVSFAGAGFIHGTNLSRLLEWAAKSGAHLDVNADGPFSAEGRVLIADNRFELTEASADIGGRPFTGDIAVSGDERRKVSVTLEAARIDTSELFPETAAALEANLRRALGVESAAPAKEADAPSDTAEAAGDGDINVRVLAGELKHGAVTYRDVDVMVGLDGDNIRIPSAKFTTSGGLVTRLDARIVKGKSSKGTLAYDFVATSPDAVKDLASLTGVDGIVPGEKIAHTNSVKAAGLLRLGNRGPGSADVSLDGTVETARIQATAEFDDGLKGWRTGTTRLRMTARGPSLPALLLAFGVETEKRTEPSAHEAELVVASTGRFASGATAIADMTAPGFTAALRGSVTLNDASAMTLAATVDVKAAEALDALALAGLTAGEGAIATPLEGSFDVTRDPAAWTLASRRVTAGNTTFKGEATFTSKPGEPETIAATIDADTVTVDGLLSAVTDRPLEAAAATPEGEEDKAAETEESDVWPRGIFNFTSLRPAIGSLTVTFATLRLDSGIAMHDGAMKIALSPEKIAVTDLTGAAAGGTVAGKLALSKAPSGTRFDGTLSVANANLQSLSPNAAGKATLEVKASAQSQSPAGLIGVLNGEGKITFDAATLRAPGPAAGTPVIKSVMEKAIPNNTDALTEEFAKAVQIAAAKVGSRSVPLTITNGVVKVAPFTLEDDGSSVTATTTADLMTMGLDSLWKLSARVPPLPQPNEQLPGYKPRAPKAALPPVDIVYTGKLGNIAALDTHINVGDMQRELSVQLMERHVDELEQIRLLDEYRAQQERERRKAEEQARLEAAAAAKAAAEKAAADKAAAEKNGAQQGSEADLPPVLPESAGTAPGADPDAAPPAPQTGAEAPAPAVNPALPPGVEAQPAPRPRPKPRREQARRSTTGDDILRSLGGYP